MSCPGRRGDGRQEDCAPGAMTVAARELKLSASVDPELEETDSVKAVGNPVSRPVKATHLVSSPLLARVSYIYKHPGCFSGW